MSARVTLTELNAADRERFAALLDGIYEHSPWVAVRAWDARPFADVAALEAALADVVQRASPEGRLDLLCRHPRLGARTRMSAQSQAEQTGAGLPGMAEAQRAELGALNEAYESRFGFPFIVAVKGLSTGDIIARCRARLENDAATEREEALRQVLRIAGLRLADRIT
jgi:OHCU decarboxylase